MDRLHKIVILAFVIGIPIAAMRLLEPAAPFCFRTGPIYPASAPTVALDFRVRVDDGILHPSLRTAFVDSIATADFALVGDLGGRDGDACRSQSP